MSKKIMCRQLLVLAILLMATGGVASGCAKPSPEAKIPPSPTPTATATRMPTPSPTPEPTATPTLTPKPTATPTPKRTATPTRKPTVTPTPVPPTPTASPTVTPAGPVTLWEADFAGGSMDGFRHATPDESPGMDCPNAPHNRSDVLAQVVDDVLELVANPHERPGVYVNAISARSIPYSSGYRYTVTGRFRLVTPDEAENVSVNLNYTRNYNSYDVIFLWITNPWNEDYGTVRVPTANGTITTHNLGVDTRWHTFELVGDFLSDGTAKYNSLTIDGSRTIIDQPVIVGKNNWPSSADVYLETANLWPSCDGVSAYKAISQWDDLRLSIEPLGP